jgi:uracil phosphoribosyltransferase
MLVDSQYSGYRHQLSEISHRYGKNIHILSDPYLFTTLSRLGHPDCRQPLLHQLLNTLYRGLVSVAMNQEFPLKEADLHSRMEALHPEGHFRGTVVDSDTRVVCVNLARAGTIPSQICFDAFNYILKPEGVRQDHIAINRKIDENEKVVGTDLGGLKIGGDINDRIVVIPDPMGATGSTIETAMRLYSQHGVARKYIALHLIVTPEYLSLLTAKYPQLIVYALRLDRGLSPTALLSSVPGTDWKQEKGLNNKQYIVPGAGGLGEVINNSYV